MWFRLELSRSLSRMYQNEFLTDYVSCYKKSSKRLGDFIVNVTEKGKRIMCLSLIHLLQKSLLKISYDEISIVHSE